MLQLKVLTQDPFGLEVDPRARVMNTCCSQKDLNLGLFFHERYEVLAITGIHVSKRQDLGCVKKQYSFRMRTVLSSILIWICPASKSVTLAKHQSVY